MAGPQTQGLIVQITQCVHMLSRKYEVMPGRQACDGVLPGFTRGFEEEE